MRRPTVEDRSATTRAVAIAAVSACAMGLGIGYFFGHSEGSAEARATAEVVQETVQAGAEAQSLRAERAETALKAHTRAMVLLRARQEIHHGIVHLHRRNFGLAEEAAHRGGEILSGLDPKREGDAELSEELKTVSVEVTPNIHDQVMLFAGLASMLDRHISVAQGAATTR